MLVNLTGPERDFDLVSKPAGAPAGYSRSSIAPSFRIGPEEAHASG